MRREHTMDSIYSFIKSYIPSSKRDPKEDFLTQILAWTLINIPEFKQDYIQFFNKHIDTPVLMDFSEDSILIETQYTNESGYIDMLIREENSGFIIEHKIDSSLSPNQIDKYKKAIEKQYNGTFYTVLITTTHMQHRQEADINLIWADIHDFILGKIDGYENHEHFLLKQLSDYLKQQGLGRMDPINLEHILGYFPGMQLENNLDKIFERLSGTDWPAHWQNIKGSKTESFLPTFKKKRWGRKGIDFYNSWDPGIFAGVIMDGTDHRLLPSDESQGPDFVVILEYDYEKNNDEITEKRNNFLWSSNFLELNKRLKLNSGSFEYLPELEGSPWRVIVLRKPLKDVLLGTSTTDEQISAMKDSICEGINLLTQDDLLGK